MVLYVRAQPCGLIIVLEYMCVHMLISCVIINLEITYTENIMSVQLATVSEQEFDINEVFEAINYERHDFTLDDYDDSFFADDIKEIVTQEKEDEL